MVAVSAVLLAACAIVQASAVVLHRSESYYESLAESVELRFGHRKGADAPFLKCLAQEDAGLGLHDRFKACLAISQSNCKPQRTLKVCAHRDAGFGSAIHTWVMSFAYALEHDMAWLPVGPWPYVDPQMCPGEGVGQSCFFQEVANCSKTTRPQLCANTYSRVKRQTLIIEASELLNVSREWVWGHLASYMLQMRPEVLKQVEARIPPEMAEGSNMAAMHIRVGSKMTGQDNFEGGRTNAGIKPYVDSLKQLINQSGMGMPRTVYVMTDDASLTQEVLNQQVPELQFVRPQRKAVDLSKASSENTTVAEVVYDLLADIQAAVRADVFIGTISNVFWLVHALKQTRIGSPGLACWYDTTGHHNDKPLLCPSDQGFYWHGPRGLSSTPEEEYMARLRAGDTEEQAKENAMANLAKRNGRSLRWQQFADMKSAWSLPKR